MKIRNYYTVLEVAQELRVSTTTVREMIADGALKGIRVGKRKLIIPGPDFQNYVKRNAVVPDGEALEGEIT